ncbi:hypothetical protein GQ600_6210 [Phytophthora cactorum]|nr:hypothetical protein GQ600_6210 [Phytophthora cactorum]
MAEIGPAPPIAASQTMISYSASSSGVEISTDRFDLGQRHLAELERSVGERFDLKLGALPAVTRVPGNVGIIDAVETRALGVLRVVVRTPQVHVVLGLRQVLLTAEVLHGTCRRGSRALSDLLR